MPGEEHHAELAEDTPLGRSSVLVVPQCDHYFTTGGGMECVRCGMTMREAAYRAAMKGTVPEERIVPTAHYGLKVNPAGIAAVKFVPLPVNTSAEEAADEPISVPARDRGI